MRSQSQIASGVNLREVLPKARFLNFPDLAIQSCCGDWEECRENDLYVAIVRPDRDGHDDAQHAIKRGAAAVLGERMLPVNRPQCIVPDSRAAFGRICHALAGNPSRHLKTIAVGGTDGKTTTSHLLQSILSAAGSTVGLHSTMSAAAGPSNENSSGPNYWPHTPAPQTAQLISDLVMQGNRYAVLEISSIDLAQHHLAGVELDTVVLTNIRGNHFDFHGSLANYRRTQERLLRYLKPTGFAVINADDPTSADLLERVDVPTITFGLRNAAEIEATLIEQSESDQTFLISAGSETVTVNTRIIGTPHVYNCLSAAAAALTHGIPLTTIAQGLERVESLPGRMNFVQCGQAFRVVIDQALTPYRLGSALKTLRQTCRGRVICVFSVPPNCSPRLAGQFGRVAERACHQPIVTLDQTGVALQLEQAHQIIDGCNEARGLHTIPNRIKAIEWALSQALPGDALLIAGQGDRPIAQMGQRRWTLTDRDVCEAWLYGAPSLSNPALATQRNEPPRILRLDDFR